MLYVGGTGVNPQIIRLVRVFSGLDQSEFAEAIGTDQPMVSRFESGERPIPERFHKEIVKVAREQADNSPLKEVLRLTR
jgi:transcriptional regulator with XRE-family HTH domain